MKKVTIYLTHLALHTREYRPTQSFQKSVEKAEVVEGLPHSTIYLKKNFTINPDGTWQMVITLPPDIQKQVDDGEIEIEFKQPKGGLLLFPGKDLVEKVAQMKAKERNELIHRGCTWHAGENDVK